MLLWSCKDMNENAQVQVDKYVLLMARAVAALAHVEHLRFADALQLLAKVKPAVSRRYSSQRGPLFMSIAGEALVRMLMSDEVGIRLSKSQYQVAVKILGRLADAHTGTRKSMPSTFSRMLLLAGHHALVGRRYAKAIGFYDRAVAGASFATGGDVGIAERWKAMARGKLETS